jgi:acetyl-CoA carboxylase biotin carboxyl carrier protein
MTKTSAEIRQLADWLGATDLGLLELTMPEGTLRLGRDRSTGAFVEVDARPAMASGRLPVDQVVSAPSVGVFRRAHPLDPLALPALGARVAAGQAIGLLQIGPLLLPLAAPCDGIVMAIHADDGAAVGYGQPLVTLRPSNL